MSSSDSPCAYQSNSPLASTEVKSLQDNIDINKLNLEKGLRNRPNQNVLVDRGILLNPGKAHSDKMHQLDLAKKRDRLKKKIENRPDREELIRKLILQEGSGNRKDEFNKIKDILDCSIMSRPGSLELVDKNILKVDRLLASKIHNGDISYPKVGMEDRTILPSISENQSQCRPPISKPNPISSKTTSQVGRFRFHNIEFRPTAQKAREYQQNELLEYQKIQAQHDPSLKEVHSEMALKSQNIVESRSSKHYATKHSLLNRLNVNELKTHCKARLISCSNLPKVLLVERLLPFESEIISSLSSFEHNRNQQMNSTDRRSISSIHAYLDQSPPDFLSQSMQTPSSCTLTCDQQQIIEQTYNGIPQGHINHSRSEPIIKDCFYSTNPVCTRQISSINPSTMHLINNVNPNNSYPSLNGDPHQSHLLNSKLLANDYPQLSIKQENACNLLQSQPYFMCSNNFFNGFDNKIETSVIQQSEPPVSLPEHYYKQIYSIDHLPPSTFDKTFDIPMMEEWSNQSSIVIPTEVQIPLIPIDCFSKFDMISKCTNEYKNIVDEINRLKNSNMTISTSLIENFKSIRHHIISLCSNMITVIERDQKLKVIDTYNASKQIKWLRNLLELMENNFINYSVKYESKVNGMELLSSNGCDISVSSEELEIRRQNSLDSMPDFFNIESNVTSEQPMDCVFLDDENFDMIFNYRNSFIDDDLKTPETPLFECYNSPMSR